MTADAQRKAGRSEGENNISEHSLKEESAMKEKIGFIGIGAMGKPMSINLLKAGYSLMTFDVNPLPLEELKEKGATIGQSSKEVASQSDVTITMLLALRMKHMKL